MPTAHDNINFDIETALCADHGLYLESLPHYGWLVRQAGTAQQRTVIGCIDEVNRGVELMELNGGFHWTSFDSLLDAVTYLVSAAPQPGQDDTFDPLSEGRGESAAGR